ncbi:Nup133 N terminal like-domain-containing protein [Zychaea mexicana]|uniref:Nup133 N terminal like-domain-containing protein n=1 Tax=Zychaea mexicana TaxID=64656 RepID=UPI0022FF2F20|nr:Nup133 N terminal like-domain-containing protein [Zychaea mexicana]KAI9491796.1 Nup133 N terminal like-domain-containing protein [Zychaea mexicana]
MLDQKSPEEITKAAHTASDTLERTSSVDTHIPTIGDLFTASSSGSYELPERQAVQPFLPKHTFTLPPVALEQIQKWKPGDAAGLLPEINRAYFAVENRLYLWDYIEKKDVNTYEETHSIVGVGLVKAKPGIFNAEITHVLVVATTMNVSIIAVAFKAQPGEPHTLSFYRTEISTNSSGAQMKEIIGTKFGRIIMLSNLGDVWELDYRREEGWFTSRCTKRLLRSATSLFTKSNDPCTSIAVDEEGRVLYRLFANSAIQVSYLGEDGLSYSEGEKNQKINDAAKLMAPSSVHVESSHFKIVSIHPTTSSEASTYQLVAITSTGCRLYFTHFKYGSTRSSPSSKPDALELVHVRTPPPVPSTPQGVPHSNALPDHPVIIKSMYKDGILLLVDKRTEQQQSIITASPNIGKMATQGRMAGFPEFANRLDTHGHVLGIAEMPGVQYTLNELASQPSEPTRHFLVFTTHGMSVVTKQRPVDMLQKLLVGVGAHISAHSGEFQGFFELFGTIHACALCFNLVCHTSTPLSGIALQASDTVSIPVVKGATQLLETLGQKPSSLNPSYSSRHDGLALFIYRLISPLWTQKIVKESVQGAVVNYSTVVSRNKLISIQQILRKLEGFMDLNASVHPQVQPQSDEERSLYELYELVALISESISFLLFLLDSDVSKVMKSLTPEMQARFKAYTFKDLLTSNEGRSLATHLAMAMIDETMARYANMDIVIDVLEQRCGTFCSSSDVILYKAKKQIQAAKNEANTMPSRDALQESLKLLKRIAIHISYEQLQEIVHDYSQQGAFVLAVELVIACAYARDPQNVTTAFLHDGFNVNDNQRLAIYKAKEPFYHCAFELLKLAISPGTEKVLSAAQRPQVFQTAFSFDDECFHLYIYKQFVDQKLGHELIKLNPPLIVDYLRDQPFDLERYELLAEYYNLHDEFEDAAQVYMYLSRVADVPISTDRRLEYVLRASTCIKSVTAPSKQFEMFDFQKRLNVWIEELQQQRQLGPMEPSRA